MTLDRIPQTALDMIVVEPEEDEEDMREIAEEYAEELDAALQDVLDNGALIFGKQKPRARLTFYRNMTLVPDLKWVLQPGYMKGLASGEFPPPISSFWLSLSSLPDFVWEHFASDFRRLIKDSPVDYWQVFELLQQEAMANDFLRP